MARLEDQSCNGGGWCVHHDISCPVLSDPRIMRSVSVHGWSSGHLSHHALWPSSVALSVGDWFFDRVGVSAIDCPYPRDNTRHNLVFK
ncbi:hypothetical protein Scep_021176 [Stephania cephalantha]|uniref:Uncharacterized protein n=1 Tax=Stephania cephalantha TaxID=152367 RepID=A0AAP0F5M7_9MAGN